MSILCYVLTLIDSQTLTSTYRKAIKSVNVYQNTPKCVIIGNIKTERISFEEFLEFG